MKICSENTAWGFYGTLLRAHGLSQRETEDYFDRAVKIMMDHFEIGTRLACEFLDSKAGRHLADRIDNLNLFGSQMAAEFRKHPTYFVNELAELMAASQD